MIEVQHARSGSTGGSFVWVLTAALALAAIGLVAIHSVSAVDSVDPTGRLVRQAAYAGLAVAVGLVVALIGHQRLIAWAPVLFAGNVFLLLLLFVPGVPTVRGRWFDLGATAFQPSEAAKITMVLFLTWFAQRKGEELATFKRGFLPAMGLVVGLAVTVMAEPDLGQGLFLLTLSSVVLLINGLRILHMAPVVLLGMGAVRVMAGTFPYVQGRIDAYVKGLRGGVDLTSQVGQGLVALAAGATTGRGPGAGRAHLNYVSEIHNDFVMVAVGEQGGVLGSTLVVVLFLLILWHGLRIAYRARSMESYSVAYAVTFMLALQACVNFAVVTASAPAKGISLPLVSYGGSAMLMVGAALGLLGSVVRESRRAEDAEDSFFLRALLGDHVVDEHAVEEADEALDVVEAISEPTPVVESPNPLPSRTPLPYRRAAGR